MKKRFYKQVSVNSDDAGHHILLDGRLLRSPAKGQLSLPNAGLAGAIADEWNAQTEEIDPAKMPLFSLAATVVDRVTPQRPDLVAEMRAFGGNDLLCYWADDTELASRQAIIWQPWLNWAKDRLRAPLEVTAGIMPISQPASTIAALESAVEAHGDWELGMLHRVVSLCGSLVLGLAFLRREMDQKSLFAAAFLDELWQSEQWGTDFEAEDRRDFIKGELDDVARFLALLRGKK